MNNRLEQQASFLVYCQSVVWRSEWMQKLVSKPRMQSDIKSFRLLYVINWRYCPMAVLLLPLLRKSCRHLFFFFLTRKLKPNFTQRQRSVIKSLFSIIPITCKSTKLTFLVLHEERLEPFTCAALNSDWFNV